MFDCITKDLKVRQKYSIVCHTFDSLLMFGNNYGYRQSFVFVALNNLHA